LICLNNELAVKDSEGWPDCHQAETLPGYRSRKGHIALSTCLGAQGAATLRDTKA